MPSVNRFVPDGAALAIGTSLEPGIPSRPATS